MPYTGRSCRFRPAQHDTDNNDVFLLVRALVRRLMIGSFIPVRMMVVPGVLSANMNSTLIQVHNQWPYNRTNNVTRYHIQNG